MGYGRPCAKQWDGATAALKINVHCFLDCFKRACTHMLVFAPPPPKRRPLIHTSVRLLVIQHAWLFLQRFSLNTSGAHTRTHRICHVSAQAIGLPISKLALHTACGGIEPATCMPVVFDVGTDNEELLQSPLYVGVRHR